MFATIIDKDRNVFHQRGSVMTPRCCHECLHQSHRSDTFGYLPMKKPTFASTTDLNICGLGAQASPHSKDGLCFSTVHWKMHVLQNERNITRQSKYSGIQMNTGPSDWHWQSSRSIGWSLPEGLSSLQEIAGSGLPLAKQLRVTLLPSLTMMSSDTL